jgi:hypothetical protein
MKDELDRKFMFHGAVIFLLTMLSGWLMVAITVKNPLMLLATHVTGFISTLLLVVIGIAGQYLSLPKDRKTVLYWSLVVSQYLFFIAGVYSAVAGTSAIFAAPPGMKGTAMQEAVVLGANVVGALAATLAAVLLVLGFRGKAH